MISAWLVHGYTASGVVLALLAARAAIENDFRAAFFWLWLQVAVDATDGLLARRARVAERLPWFDGAALDQIVDYLTFVFVPALLVWRAALVPGTWAIPVASLMLLSSAYGFNRTDAKTSDHFFTGWPSYWNVVTFYLLVLKWPAVVNLAVLVAFAILVFVPIRYIYPSRMPVLRVTTNALGVVWGISMLVMLWQYPSVSRVVLWGSLVFVIYYHGLSLALHVGRGRGQSPEGV